MSRATPEMRDFAERLIAYENRGNVFSRTKTQTGFHVCEKLRPHLAKLLGNTGFHALISRALVLGESEASQLRVVQVKEDGSLTGWEEGVAQGPAEKLAEGGVAVLAQFLGLLEAFVGGLLTLQLLRDVWPKLTLSELYFAKREKNEKTN